jgi:hypothetical protein
MTSYQPTNHIDSIESILMLSDDEDGVIFTSRRRGRSSVFSSNLAASSHKSRETSSCSLIVSSFLWSLLLHLIDQMDFGDMQAQHKLGLLVSRGSRGSLKKMENSGVSPPSSSVSSALLRRGASTLGYDLEMIGLWRQESEVSRDQSSPSSFRSSHAQFKRESPLSGTSLCNKSFENNRVEMPSSLLKFLFVVVTVLQVDKVLDAVVSILRRKMHHFPFLVQFNFIQVLVKMGNDSVADSLSGMTHCSSEDDPSDLGDSGFSDIQDAIDEANANEEDTMPVTIVTANDEDVDDYGFFADFE